MSYQKRHCRIHGDYTSIDGDGCGRCREERTEKRIKREGREMARWRSERTQEENKHLRSLLGEKGFQEHRQEEGYREMARQSREKKAIPIVVLQEQQPEAVESGWREPSMGVGERLFNIIMSLWEASAIAFIAAVVVGVIAGSFAWFFWAFIVIDVLVALILVFE